LPDRRAVHRLVTVKNPENLTDKQKARLSTLETLNRPLFRASLLKKMLRLVFATKGDEGIEASLRHRMSNGRVEATNNPPRELTEVNVDELE
jgi:transposase